MSLFPITCAAYETPHYTSSPYRYQGALRAALLVASPKATWYAFDAILLSRTEIEFVVYDMRDNLSGGIGRETHRFKTTVPSELTLKDVENAIWRAAALQRADELANAEHEIIEGYAAIIRESTK